MRVLQVCYNGFTPILVADCRSVLQTAYKGSIGCMINVFKGLEELSSPVQTREVLAKNQRFGA